MNYDIFRGMMFIIWSIACVLVGAAGGQDVTQDHWKDCQSAGGSFEQCLEIVEDRNNS